MKYYLFLLLLNLSFASSAQKKSTTMDYQLITEAVTNIFVGADERNWDLLTTAFDEKVLLDYSSFTGNPAATLPASEIIASWKAIFPGFNNTHHQAGNFKVVHKDKEATVFCYGTATHYLPNESGKDLWTVVGTYDFHLVQKNGQWKTDRMRFHFKYQTGNTSLPQLAMEKVKQSATTTNNQTDMTSSITKKKISYVSEGLTLAGDLYLPAGFDEHQKYPVVMVTGSWTTVKEQMPALYARKLAAKGFLSLAFDFRFNGASEGQPRHYESPENKIVDFRNTVSYLHTLPFVNKEQVYGLGICASAGYLARAAAEDSRIKRIGLVAPWLHNATIVREIYGGEAGVQSRVEAGKKAKINYAANGTMQYVPAVSETDPQAAMFGPFTYYLDPQRGAIPEWPNQLALASWPEWLEFDGIRTAATLTTPTLLVHSVEAAIPHGVKQFYQQLKSTRKDLVWTTGNQFDFYDKETTVNFSVEKATDWFRKK